MITKEDLAQAILELKEHQIQADARQEKADARQEKADARQEKAFIELKASQEKTDTQLAKTDARLNKIAKMCGGMGNNQGDVAEEFYFNSLKKNPVLNGIHFDFIDKNISRNWHGIEDEYDLLLVNGKDVFIIEVKYKAHARDLKRLLDIKYPNFKKLFAEYKDYTHHLGLATFHINDELKKSAHEQNVTVLQRSGNVIKTLSA